MCSCKSIPNNIDFENVTSKTSLMSYKLIPKLFNPDFKNLVYSEVKKTSQ
jgi:hypothetical protein